jgi:drug/metabolite transporter (DMT)-like permease
MTRHQLSHLLPGLMLIIFGLFVALHIVRLDLDWGDEFDVVFSALLGSACFVSGLMSILWTYRQK